MDVDPQKEGEYKNINKKKLIMARYIGPKSKISRKFGEPIFGADKVLEKRNYPPGQHGNNRRRPKKSEYAIQLMEKQKAKYTYGILERQFSNIFKKANSSKGVTGEVLLQLCESRLDNVAFRLGISPSRNGARQLVTHKHITVDGEIVNIPSYTLKPGQIIGIRERSKSLKAIISSLESNNSNYDWLTWNQDKFEGVFVNQPERSQIPENIKEQLIVELYSK
jgi:small subunit ribosomal protein S4